MRASIRAFLWRLTHLGRRPRSEASLDGELEFHLQMEIQENLRRGMSPEEARRRALVALGGLDQTKERHRDERSFRLLENLAQDLRFAFRTYRKNPGFVAVVVLTLMLGIGVNVAFFTVFNWVVLNPPLARDPSRLVTISVSQKPREGAFTKSYFSPAEYRTLRDNDNIFDGLAAYARTNVVSPFGVLNGRLASANYFSVLGADMAMGRTYTAEEDNNALPVVVLSYRSWQQRFKGDAEILGKQLRLADASFTIVGVTDQSFGGLDFDVPEFWAPVGMEPVLNRRLPQTSAKPDNRISLLLTIAGRLPRGMSIEQATARLSALASRVLPVTDGVTSASLESHSTRVPINRQVLLASVPLSIVFTLVLLIACANVANLLLARAASRRREISVRLSLGASRPRLVQQLFTESTVLSIAGGFLSLLFAGSLDRWFVRHLIAAIPSLTAAQMSFPDIQVDLRVFVYTFLVSLATAVVFGVAPALESARADQTAGLKDEGVPLFRRIRGSRQRAALVVVQISLCLLLLIGAGLLLRSAVKASTFDRGFDVANVLDLQIVQRVQGEDHPETRTLLAERLRTLPQVKAVSLAVQGIEANMRWPITVDGRKVPSVRYLYVTPEYFQTLRIPLVRGRHFSREEVDTEAPVAIISESAASVFWPGQNAMGKRISVVTPSWRIKSLAPAEVVAVARDASFVWGTETVCVYLPVRPQNPENRAFLVRVDGDIGRAADEIRAQFRGIASDAILDIRLLSDILDRAVTPFRMFSRIAIGLGMLGLLLATVGLHGVASYAVSQRTHEIGIRMALGAERSDVLWLILRQGLRQTVVGTLIGIALAAAFSRLLASILFRVSPFDLATFTLVPIVLILVCLAAAYIPARRATRVDPVVALRHE